MPFKSQAQRKFMFAKHPKIAKKWAHDKGFYGHMTHASVQPNEDSVENIGSGQDDADYPKSPTSDGFVSSKKVFYT